MIIYFADRQLNVIGQASTRLPQGVLISDDKKTEDLKTGSKSLECDVNYTDRATIEEWTAPGNHILKAADNGNELYIIIDSELNMAERTVSIYADGAGLGMLNAIVGDYTATTAMGISSYFNAFAGNTGFEVGINEVSDQTRTLAWTGESTVTERLLSLAEQFGAELSFSYEIDRLSVEHKYVNFWQRRGRDTGTILRMGKHLSNLRIKRTVANLATSLLVQGGTPAGSSTPITLNGYSYDDGDIYITGSYIKTRTGIETWGDIEKVWTHDTTSQSELCTASLKHLKDVSQMETIYEAEVIDLPPNVGIGDTVHIADEEGNQYITARIMKIVTGDADGTRDIELSSYTAE